MQAYHNHQAEISALEIEISHYQKLLDKSFEDDECLEKTKTIFHDLKSLTEKLDELKNETKHKNVK